MAGQAKVIMGMLIFPDRCIDCKACVIACQAENKVPLGRARLRINHKASLGPCPRVGTLFEPENCHHCDAPSCMRVCPTGATYKREDGLVLVHWDQCIGCRYCVLACPYDMRYPHPEYGVADKCTFCEHRLARSEEPACVQTCLSRARKFGDLSDPNGELRQILSKRRHYRKKEQAGTGPQIYYVFE